MLVIFDPILSIHILPMQHGPILHGSRDESLVYGRVTMMQGSQTDGNTRLIKLEWTLITMPY